MGQSRPVGRVIALLGLLLAAGVTLRGALPTPNPVPREPRAETAGSLTGIIVLLSAAMLVMAVALFSRDRALPRPPGREFGDGRRGVRSRWNLRLGLIALGALAAWLLAVVVLNRLGLGPDSRQLPPPTVVPDAGDVSRSVPHPGAAAPTRSDTFRLLMATTATLVVMTVIATVLAALRRPRPESQAIDGTPAATVAADPDPLAMAAERGLVQVANPNLAPRQAIIACYAAMEQALADAPDSAPRASDTPSEVLARAVGNRTLSPGRATELVALFTEARFSPHEMTEEHRDAAEHALRAVLRELDGAR